MAYDLGSRESPLTLLEPIQLDTARVVKPYLSGMALSVDGEVLFVADAHGQSLIEVDLMTRQTRRLIALEGIPYQFPI